MTPNPIGWCHETLNWQAGCSPASLGCLHCWALRMTRRMVCNPGMARGRYQPSIIGADGWSGEIRFDLSSWGQAFDKIARSRQAKRWFLGSMTDLFHENTPQQAWDYLAIGITDCPTRQTLILSTKRPLRLLEWQRRYFPNGLPSNVWCLLSVANQEDADEKTSTFLEVRGSMLGWQVEPMLGPILPGGAHFDCGAWCNVLTGEGIHPKAAGQSIPNWQGPHLSWCIIGPENGPLARPYDPAWGRDLAQQCVDAGVPVWGKAGSGIERQELPNA